MPSSNKNELCDDIIDHMARLRHSLGVQPELFDVCLPSFSTAASYNQLCHVLGDLWPAHSLSM